MLLRFIDGTASKSGQRLDNVNWPHLVQASGKLVLQKERCNLSRVGPHLDLVHGGHVVHQVHDGRVERLRGESGVDNNLKKESAYDKQPGR